MTLEIQFIPYEPKLMDAVNAYAADMAHLADEAYTKENHEFAAKIWDTAKRLEGSPSHWGGVVPGVGLDCAGSVMAVHAERCSGCSFRWLLCSAIHRNNLNNVIACFKTYSIYTDIIRINTYKLIIKLHIC